MAVTINAQSLAHALRITDSPGTVLNTEQAATVARLLGAATALVDNYSILAPDHVANEGVVRLAGWMYDQPVGRQNADAYGTVGSAVHACPLAYQTGKERRGERRRRRYWHSTGRAASRRVRRRGSLDTY